MDKLQIVYRPVAELWARRYPNNPRINDEAAERLAGVISRYTFLDPIILDAAGEIIAGDTRLKAAKLQGIEEVPTISADHLTPEQAKSLRLVHNRTAEWAEWDKPLLSAELDELLQLGVDLSEYDFDVSMVFAEDYGTAFDLPDGEKNPICVMNLTLHERQVATIEEAIAMVKESGVEVDGFGNPNAKGNAVYEVVRQWVEQKKSK